MQLSQLSAKPQLIKLTLDGEDIVKTYGEALEFYTWDRQPLDVFLKLASIESTNHAGMMDVLRTMIMDEAGNPVIAGDNMIPVQVLTAAMHEITKLLGKS
jgi:hypothetical protein